MVMDAHGDVGGSPNKVRPQVLVVTVIVRVC